MNSSPLAGGIYRRDAVVQPSGILEVPWSYDSPENLVKIIHRYILKEHVGPFVFALSALTSLLLLQYIARKFGDLVGRGLSWQVITEFMLLSIPFTLAMTLPMAVLVSVLYAFSRLAAENEVTALKAGGVSARSLMWPSVICGVVARRVHAVVQRPAAAARESRAGHAADGDPAHEADVRACGRRSSTR